MKKANCTPSCASFEKNDCSLLAHLSVSFAGQVVLLVTVLLGSCRIEQLKVQNEVLQERLEEEVGLAQKLRQIQVSKDDAVTTLQADA